VEDERPGKVRDGWLKWRRFRWLLPTAQVPLAVVFGSIGLRQRWAILDRRFLGETLRHSTAVYHVWPWPYRVAASANLPAVLCGGVTSRILGLPEGWADACLSLPFVWLLWYWVGWRLDGWPVKSAGIFLLLTMGALVGAGLCPFGYIGFLYLGAVVWIIAMPVVIFR
jgi:hypothetical protein